MPDFDADQQKVIDDPMGPRSVIAGPGAGKTTTMVGLINELIRGGISASDIRALTFSKEMATALEKKLKVKGVASTFHSLGYLICSETERKPVEPELRHRLMCKLVRKWGLDYKELDGFIAKMRRENISPTDAYNAGGLDLPYSMCSAYAEYENERARGGWMDFDAMLADSVKMLENAQTRARWQPKYLIVDEAQDTDNCHPAGTLIRKLVGAHWGPGHKARWEEVPIETLQDGDAVVSWSRRRATLTADPQPITIGKRQFIGTLVQVTCGTKTVEATPDHKFYVTLNGSEQGTYVVYLMHRSDLGFRVGQCAMRYNRQSKKQRESMPGLGTRFTEERAERGWILRVCQTKEESVAWEQIYSCNFGIPYATYGDKTYSSPFRKRNAGMSAIIFSSTNARGKDCLESEGLDFNYPLYERAETSQERKSPSQRYFVTAACNLRPEIMSLPSTDQCKQEAITAVTRRPYSGLVYSMNVPKHHTYVANGLVVKNCQWRMMQLMSEKHGNITIVGDPNQAIYGFRGAKPENITNFDTWFPGGRKLYLGLNYRSTETIVNFGRENAPKGTPKELLDRMKAFRSVKGAPIALKMYWSDDAEAESALALAQKDALNSVILARTNRMVGLLERLCNRYNIRYHLLGKTGFWKQNEIRKAVEALKSYPRISTVAGFNLTLPDIERKYAVDDRTDRDNDALENLKVLRVIGKDYRMAKDFVVYANKMMHRRNDPKGVTISTVHQAKGGEWKNVFIVGANAKGFPHPKGDEQEEARIYYVAITRPTDVLRISFAGTPSPYLRKYLTDEILDKLREHAEEIDRLESQTNLFA